MTWKDYVNLDDIRKKQILFNQQKDKQLLEQLKKEQRKIEHQKQINEIAEKAKLKQQKKKSREQLEEFRGEYMDYHCPSCNGKLKIVYTKWSTTHFAKAICEECNRFDRWLAKPKPDGEFK